MGCQHPGNPIKASAVRTPLLLLFLGSVLGLGACATTPLNRDFAVPIETRTSAYTMALLDEVTVTFRDGTRETFTVQQDGNLDLATVPVRALDRPVAAVERDVRRALPATAEIEVREFRPNRVTVLGEVFHQIHTDLGDGPMRIMDAIAAANGFTPLANKRRVRLLRSNAGRIEVYELDLRRLMRGDDLEANLLLEPGDVITVPRNFL